ncbi:hypothetical protein EBB07_06065 [Paenibacillaceae bacterium]|nr:hypothetical protein EBB07_06065 [Paenibacillaceae bacterium]
METILNERKYIYRLVAQRIVDPNMYNAARLLIKYYVIHEMDKQKIGIAISNYLKTHYEGVDEETRDRMVVKYVNAAMKRKQALAQSGEEWQLHDLDWICIWQSELAKISALQDVKLERLAFILLVYSKLAQARAGRQGQMDEYGVYCDKEIFRESLLPYSFKSKLLINRLKELEYVLPNMHNGNSNYVSVLFASKGNNAGDKILFTISDFRNVVYMYEKFNGNKHVSHCSQCRMLFEKRSGNHKYCTACEKEKQLEYQRQSMQKRRRNLQSC